MLGLTAQERRVILFLITMALVGLGIEFLVKINSPLKVIVNAYQGLGKINLNSAGKEELKSLGGIGEKLAQRIIDYRAKVEGFKETDELKNIKGISDDKYEKIKDFLVVK
jgi:competence ComEA-like helix-hairpin-helix protein